MKISKQEIARQLNRVIADGWLPFFQTAAQKAGTTTAHFLAIGSRETNLKNIRGDFRGGMYHGYGVMQVDIGTDAEYARTWTPQKVEPSIRRGGEIYLSKLKQVKNGVGKKLTVRGRSFVGREVDNDDARRIATAAYNCGLWAYYHFCSGQNVDTTTTGDDYSRDVYDRAVYFADLLEQMNIERKAVYNELFLQGKYARASHLAEFGVKLSANRLKLPAGDAQETQSALEQTDYERPSAAENPTELQDPKPQQPPIETTEIKKTLRARRLPKQ